MPTSTTKPRLLRIRLWLWGAVALMAAALGGYQLLRGNGAPSPTAADAYASAFGGSFAMTDQTGRTVTDQTLRGKPYAIFFGFTRCPDVCPTTLSRMAALRKQLGADGDKFQIVFVSVDPEHDKAKDIGTYLTLFNTPIVGLTGTDAQIAQIVKAFHIYYAKVPVAGGDYTIDHTASVFLMDKDGKFVATIAHEEDQRVALEKVKRLMEA
ncbi:SCO family protein [Sphingomonas sp.]|uniref:SCO family protein n=1 Tax=Sphingomonas sp. TaxID=28214 RepID=UPI003F722F8D